MKLYGHPMSNCTRRVLCTVAEKGATIDLHPIDLFKGEQKSAAHLARHPFGRVPVLDDDGFVLYESRAIGRYLDANLPGKKLVPTEPKAAALVDQWESVDSSYFTPAAVTILVQKVMHPMMGATTDAAAVDGARKDAAQALDALEGALARTPYLAGEELTFADVCFMPYVDALFQSQEGALVTSRKHVADWWQRVSARPSWKQATRA